jgi:hypothetical protein
VVALITGSGATNEIAFGLPLDIGGQNFYARSSARPELLTVKGSTRGLVPRRLDDWLDRDLLHLDPSEVGRFTVSASRILAAEGNLNLTFELGDDGAWHSLDEPDARINEENLDQLLRLFGRLSADSVVTTAPESLEDFGLQRPVMSFIWRSRDGSVTEHLDIGRGVSAGQPTAYCRRGGDQTVYAAPSSYDRAMVLALDLVDRHLVRSDISHAARIDYRNADLTVEFKRVGGIWRRMSPGGSPGREITVERIEAALIRLVNATHRGPIEDPLAGAVRSQLANPPWAVIIFDAEDNRLADVRASEVPLAEGTNEQIMVLLDEERAVRVGRGVLSQVKDGLDHLIRLQ